MQKENKCAILTADDTGNDQGQTLERLSNVSHKHEYEREIVYDPETRDFAMYLDHELIGFARTYHEAEVTLDQLVFELLNGHYFREAA